MSLKQNLLKVVDSALELAKECGNSIEARSAVVKIQQAKNAVMQLDDDATEIPKVETAPVVEEEIVTEEITEEDTKGEE